jgi:hypothetical protein
MHGMLASMVWLILGNILGPMMTMQGSLKGPRIDSRVDAMDDTRYHIESRP